MTTGTQGARCGRPGPFLGALLRTAQRKAVTEAASPSTATSSAPGRAQARTLSASWRMRPLSRWALTTPPNHSRGLTISAIAIHTIPCCMRTRISSACPCRKDQHAPRTR